jgi:hypothetical protein
VYAARVGAVITKSGSATFVGTNQYGNRAQYTGLAPYLASGAAGNTTTPTWASVSLLSYVPPTAEAVVGFLSVPTSGAIGMVAPNNNYSAYNAASNRAPVSASFSGLAGGAISIPFTFLLESTNIYWAASGASSQLVCLGWIDNL